MSAADTRTLLDRFAIIDVVTRYAVSIDRREWDALESCFEPEIEVNAIFTQGAWARFDRTRLLTMVQNIFAQYDATQHLSVNHQVDVRSDEATCVSTLNATHHIAGLEGGTTQRQIGYYEYGLRRRDRWRIDRVRQILFWEDGNAEIIERAHRGIEGPKPDQHRTHDA